MFAKHLAKDIQLFFTFFNCNNSNSNVGFRAETWSDQSKRVATWNVLPNQEKESNWCLNEQSQLASERKQGKNQTEPVYYYDYVLC